MGCLVRGTEPHPDERWHHRHSRLRGRPACAARPPPEATRPGATNRLGHTDRPITKGDNMTSRTPVDTMRKTALVAGLLNLLTFVSIPTLALLGPIKADPGFILGTGSDTPLLVSGFLEIVVALAGIGSALALFSVLKRQNESLA